MMRTRLCPPAPRLPRSFAGAHLVEHRVVGASVAHAHGALDKDDLRACGWCVCVCVYVCVCVCVCACVSAFPCGRRHQLCHQGTLQGSFCTLGSLPTDAPLQSTLKIRTAHAGARASRRGAARVRTCLAFQTSMTGMPAMTLLGSSKAALFTVSFAPSTFRFRGWRWGRWGRREVRHLHRFPIPDPRSQIPDHIHGCPAGSPARRRTCRCPR